MTPKSLDALPTFQIPYFSSPIKRTSCTNISSQIKFCTRNFICMFIQYMYAFASPYIPVLEYISCLQQPFNRMIPRLTISLFNQTACLQLLHCDRKASVYIYLFQHPILAQSYLWSLQLYGMCSDQNLSKLFCLHDHLMFTGVTQFHHAKSLQSYQRIQSRFDRLNI